MSISRRKLPWNPTPIIQVGAAHPKIFVEKTFEGGSQTAKFVKVFSLRCFPLYGMVLQLISISIDAIVVCFSWAVCGLYKFSSPMLGLVTAVTMTEHCSYSYNTIIPTLITLLYSWKYPPRGYGEVDPSQLTSFDLLL